jgi:NADPH:quinone reductase
MRAVRVHTFGDPDVLQVEQVADLRPPGAGEVLIRLHAAGVNPVDAYMRSGQYAALPPLPYTPGSDGAGVVEAVGQGDASGGRAAGEGAATGKAAPAGAVGAHGPAVGDRVYTSGSLTGTYAEKALCRVEQVHALPDAIGFAAGAALGVPYATAYRALFQRGQASAGDLVLVHGASGGVGIAAVQFAIGAGLTVHGTAGSEDGRRLVAAQGAAAVVDHTAPGSAAELLALTGGRGYDVIVEMAAHASLGIDLGLLARGGRVVVVGSRGPVEIAPRELMGRDADVRGMLLFVAPPAALAEAYAAVGEGLAAGLLHPLVGRELPLADAATAHREIMAGPAVGKLVLAP